MRSVLLAFSLALAPTSLHVQGASPYDGKWLGTYTTKKGAERSAILHLSDGGGTWTNDLRRKKDRCLGREMPVSIVRATATDLMIRIHGSKFLQGCADFSVKFSRTGENMLEGKVPKVGNLMLTRQ